MSKQKKRFNLIQGPPATIYVDTQGMKIFTLNYDGRHLISIAKDLDEAISEMYKTLLLEFRNIGTLKFFQDNFMHSIDILDLNSF